MVFDQEALNITAIKEGVIFNKFTILEKNWNSKFFSNIKANDLKSICNFISSVSNSFDGFDLVLCTVNGEEKKEEYENLFNQIKKFVEENVEEQINVYIYDENEFLAKIIKYIGIFSEE
jgi:enoyl-[acyl-carrier-protein] reductase (NADH)